MPEMPEKAYRDAEVNGEITITIPVHVALGFIAEYNATDWAAMNAGIVITAIMRQVLDPPYLKAAEAHLNAMKEQQEAIHVHAVQGFLHGQIPGFLPPEFTE